MSNESFSNNNNRVESTVSSMKQVQIERWSRRMEESLSNFSDAPGVWDTRINQIRERASPTNLEK